MNFSLLIKLLNKEIELKIIQRDKCIAVSEKNYAEAAKLREIEIKLTKEFQKLESKYNLKK